ncbi:DUF1254 domain-containing protein [Solitalea canadensis]|uniref:DUF1254 domain-containing protein n=1 Tax=Solitalea canadensis (strain ATCC 29591 / DSM 3403 / JCM 21819 / LMG 8368 / NBRC 15130 / NCIMB 12057 / USAM 9D) TaxID=929556 RepID=H8KU17_SOLCM|nr:DUF1254 domain-containing protein [Solitalea canadensis]AFD06997.1 hypothetical protein Solca_1938 [Solitalea canadensis DSM 3403]
MKMFFVLVPFVVLLSCKQQSKNEKESNKIIQTAASELEPIQIKMDGELPAKESVPILFDEMDYQQATQCYLWAFPLVSFASEMETQEKVFGATSNDLVLYNTYEDKLGILTANATTPYILSFFNLAKTGPMVIEMPPGAIAGGLTDCWQREIIAIGEAGPDKGNGGKFIFYPPGSVADKLPGYFNVTCPTMNIWFGLRALDPDPKKDEALVNAVKLYPYSQRNNSPQTKVISPGGKKYLMAPPQGLEYWKRLYDILQNEPVEERDRLFIAWLDNLGIKIGKPFNPSESQKKILTAAADRGHLMAIANSFKKRFENARHWSDREWDYPMVISDPSQRAQNYDEFFQRTSYFYEAVGYSKAMISKTPNFGQAYLATYADKDGNWLDGAKSYHLRMPANPPAANFWSVTIYDAATRCLIDNPQKNADLSSRKDLLKNNDGSVDLYFGPTAPAGKEKNWVQTIPGKHWFTYVRFYGPTKAYFDKSWKMDDIEEMK